jgi:LuxR family transcriptional regulator, quorum-sensing system regulator BjaR1
MDELERLMAQVLVGFGVTDFSMTAAIARPDNKARVPKKLTNTVSTVWSDRYLERKYYNVDYVVHLALQQPYAFSWADFEESSMPDAARALFAECRSCLKVDGALIVPTHDSGGFAGFIAMLHEQTKLEPEVQKALKLIAVYGIERAKELHGLALDRAGWDAPCPLTARQREVLSFAAAGKSDWDVAQIVGLSEKTVNHHFERAKRTLDVKTRAQAVAVAVQRGWVAI